MTDVRNENRPDVRNDKNTECSEHKMTDFRNEFW
ncbi:unnamed protein product, partial [Rotaria sp. Silwood2]